MSPFGVIVFIATIWLCITYVTVESAPAWVQAFGSVGAIWATAKVASRQQREQSKYRLEKDRVVIAAVAEIARAASMGVEQIYELAINDQVKARTFEFVNQIEYVEKQLQTIKGIELISLPKEEMIQPFLQLNHNIQSATEGARKYLAGVSGDELSSISVKMYFSKNILKNLEKKFAAF